MNLVVFCENGSQMLDVMLGSLIYPNKQATKNTNLVYIDKIEEIFSSFDNDQFKIELPFKDMTKAEMLVPFKGTIKFDDAFSCFSTRYRTGTAMCGVCYNCFIRRISLRAIDVQEADTAYEINPFEFNFEMVEKKSYSDTIDILFHLLRFYHKILLRDSSAIDEVKISTRHYFKDPVDLATRFAKDIFLGTMKLIQTINEDQLNAVGKKAKELLGKIDKTTLIEREEELTKQE